MTLVTTTLGEKLREAIEKKNLATTINQWDDEDNATKQNIKDIPVITTQTNGTPKFPITTNASRVTFDFILKHGGQYTAMQIAAELEKQGQKFSTVTSLCYQLIKNKLVLKHQDGTLQAIATTYTPVKSAATLRNKARKEAEAVCGFSDAPPKRKIVIINKTTGHKLEVGGGAGIAALKQEPVNIPWSADAVLDSLSLTQGHALYLKLKEIFGG